MARNIRKCDVCATVFEVRDKGYHVLSQYNPLELPIPQSLESTIERVVENKVRQRVRTIECDICADCLIAICEAMLARRELQG